ncbi:hypothetical protein YPPY102_1829, partial [Yersinia pestis PY-102]
MRGCQTNKSDRTR